MMMTTMRIQKYDMMMMIIIIIIIIIIIMSVFPERLSV